MLIALDYDGTYTADPSLWDAFILNAQHHGHTVILATMRYPHEGVEVEEQLENKVDKIIYTSRCAKRDSVVMQYGRIPDVWIDDNPAWIYTDSH